MHQRRLAALAKGQLGVFTRAQAREVGFSTSQLRHRVRSGVLEQIGTNVFRFPGAPMGPGAQLHALVLDVGGDVWVAGPTAAALYGFDRFELAPPFHLTIRRGRDVQRVRHRIHTTVFVASDDETIRDGFRTFKPARLLLDLARIVDAGQLAVAVECAMRDRWVSDWALRRRVAELSPLGRYGTQNLLAVLDERDRKLGAHSFLERSFLELVERAGLPRPMCQEVLGRARDRVVRVDFRFPGTRVIVEVLGYRFHRSKQSMQRDAERLNSLVLGGQLPLQFTYEDVLDDPEHVVSTLAQALVSADAA